MLLCVAGGRDLSLGPDGEDFLDQLDETYCFTGLVNGKASGVDACAVDWAMRRGIPVRYYPAQWDTFGRRAGPIRNKRMAIASDLVVLFNGGAGTQAMWKAAEDAGTLIIDKRT